jgi:hypothetical protein
MTHATFHGSAGEFSLLLAELNDSIGGDTNGFDTYVRPIYESMGVALLGQIQQAFIVKSRGGTGSDGIKWVPLKPETIAQRRIGPGDLVAIGVKGAKIPAGRVRGLLTPDQDRRWRQIFHQVYSRSVFELGDAEAKAKAGRIAWSVLKSEGAMTKLEVLGNRQVDILRDTSTLFRSLSPTTAELQPEGQIFEVEPGAVTVGTSINAWHHEGVPGRLPARPFWPLNGDLPQSWWQAVTDAMKNGINKALVMIAERKRM